MHFRSVYGFVVKFWFGSTDFQFELSEELPLATFEQFTNT